MALHSICYRCANDGRLHMLRHRLITFVIKLAFDGVPWDGKATKIPTRLFESCYVFEEEPVGDSVESIDTEPYAGEQPYRHTGDRMGSCNARLIFNWCTHPLLKSKHQAISATIYEHDCVHFVLWADLLVRTAQLLYPNFSAESVHWYVLLEFFPEPLWEVVLWKISIELHICFHVMGHLDTHITVLFGFGDRCIKTCKG